MEDVLRVYARRREQEASRQPRHALALGAELAVRAAGRVRAEVQGPARGVRRAGAVRAARPAARLRGRHRPRDGQELRRHPGELQEVYRRAARARRARRAGRLGGFLARRLQRLRERREGPRGAFPERHDRGVRERARGPHRVRRADRCASRDERRSARGVAYRKVRRPADFGALRGVRRRARRNQTALRHAQGEPASAPERAAARGRGGVGAHAAHAPEGALGRAGGGGGGVDGGARGCETRGGAAGKRVGFRRPRRRRRGRRPF